MPMAAINAKPKPAPQMKPNIEKPKDNNYIEELLNLSRERFDLYLSEKRKNDLTNKLINLNPEDLKNNESKIKNKLLEKLFEVYIILDNINDGKVNREDGIKRILSLIDEFLERVDSFDEQDFELKKALLEKLKDINNVIELDDEELVAKLRSVFDDVKLILQGKDLKNNASIDPNSTIPKGHVSFEEINNAYKNLYDAINENDIKNITVYRGRLIKILKKYQTAIDEKYQGVLGLIEIKKILDSYKEFDSTEIRNVLDKEENLRYKYIFEPLLGNREKFMEMFEKIYQDTDAERINLYKEALGIELKNHADVLNKRYDKEFLGERGKLSGLITTLPKAFILSIKKLANTINEYKNSKTELKKHKEAMEIIKDAGRVVATPVIYVGKVAANNWYALYKIIKGIREPEKVEEERKNQQQETTEDSVDDSKTIEKEIKEEANSSEEEASPNTIEQEKNDANTSTEDNSVVDAQRREIVEKKIDAFEKDNEYEVPQPKPVPKPDPEAPENKVDPSTNDNNPPVDGYMGEYQSYWGPGSWEREIVEEIRKSREK